MKHKELRFFTKDFELPIKDNEAFLLNDPTVKASFQKRYEDYKGQPPFNEVIGRIRGYVDKL